MADYSVSVLTKEVLVAMDMNEKREALIKENDADTLTLEEIVASKIAQAARVVESNAPVWLLDSGRALSGSITFAKEVGKGRGRMQLPDDFMRLITFKMSDWERAVTQPILETDPQYLLQSSRFAGLRGTPQKPVVSIVSEPTGLVLEFWSCVGGETVTLQRGRYLPIPRIKSGGIEVCEKLKDAVVLYAAYLTCLATGHTEQAQGLLEQSKELMM
ncbi:MAG: hypothetical protein NC212_08455 [Staphylococcus sp.]|nr:hypothetical protein [Staphylococcus sp.]